MKIRADFVTNSSSSSYIIGKTEDNSVTVDSVYQLLRKLYAEDKVVGKELKEIVDFDSFVFTNTLSDGKKYFHYHKGMKWYMVFENSEDVPDKPHLNINTTGVVVDPVLYGKLDKFFKEKGIDEYHLHYYDDDLLDEWWLSCEKYEDYVRYCTEKKASHLFRITDYSIPKKTEGVMDEYSTDSNSDVLGWYHSDIVAAAFHSLDKDCENCKGCTLWCDDDTDHSSCPEHCGTYLCLWWSDDEKISKIKECQSLIREKNIPEELACLYFLGRICVHSWCRDIPHYVVAKLGEISLYWCEHMG